MAQTVQIPPVLKREDVLKKLSALQSVDIRDAVDRVNKALQEALLFPLVMSEKDLGSTNIVANQVISLLRGAGWRVERIPENANSRSVDFYNIS